MGADWAPAGVDPTKANVARMYDYFLEGKNNFAADREAAEKVLALMPQVPKSARHNRAFLTRVVRYLASECGIRQFLDVGTGLPTQGQVHGVAREIAPDARVVYVDNDPVVAAHGRAMLAHTDNAAIIQADLRDPESILDHPDTRALLDFERPVAILLVAVLHFLTDADDPYRVVARFRDATVPGSYLVVSHGAPDDISPEVKAAVERVYVGASAPGTWRTRDEIERFFDGYTLVEPGLVHGARRWRSDEPVGADEPVLGYAGVGHKPR